MSPRSGSGRISSLSPSGRRLTSRCRSSCRGCSAIPRSTSARIAASRVPALLRGRGRFLDDVEVPGLRHVAFVRSPHAHARVGPIDVAPALAVPGVEAVVTAADLEAVLTDPRLPLHFPPGRLGHEAMPPVLAGAEVRYAGEAVALEGLVDLAARRLGIDRAEIRRRNLIPPEAMPWTSGLRNRAGKEVA